VADNLFPLIRICFETGKEGEKKGGKKKPAATQARKLSEVRATRVGSKRGLDAAQDAGFAFSRSNTILERR